MICIFPRVDRKIMDRKIFWTRLVSTRSAQPRGHLTAAILLLRCWIEFSPNIDTLATARPWIGP